MFARSQRGRKREKSGVPKNAGISNDVYENKGQNKSLLGMSNDVYENRKLSCFSEDVYQNKILNDLLTRF
jgi:hypothetical protein